MTTTGSGRMRRLRFAPLALAVGALSSAVLGLSATGTLSAFTAQINNTVDTAASGTLIMTETGTGSTTGTCASSSGTNGVYSCSTVNKFGGATGLTPGQSSVGTITIGNTGSAAASTFTLAPTTAGSSPDYGCTSSNVGAASGNATDSCTQFQLKLESGSTVIYNGSVAGFSSFNLGAVTPVGGGATVNLIPAPGATTPFRFTVTLPSSAGNAYQGKQVSTPLTWTFGA